MFKHPFLSVTLLLAATSAAITWADQPKPDADRLLPLFNGADLSGWVIVNVAPNTFTARDGILVSTGKPTGVIRTDKQYENFVLELEWRHMEPGGNAGLFIWGDPMTAQGTPFTRGIEVQILDHQYVAQQEKRQGKKLDSFTGHGDIFPIHGATMKPDRPHPQGWARCLPSEFRAKPSGQWNHYRVVCNDGKITLSVNGKEVSGGSECKPRKGYICLESEGAECHFRNIRIKELPSTSPSADETANTAENFVPMYTGVDLAGWKVAPGSQGHWQPSDWILKYDGRSEAAQPNDRHLWTEKEYGDFEMIVDWRLVGKPEKKSYPVVLPSGDEAVGDDGQPKMVEVEDYGNSGIMLRGSEDAQANISCYPSDSGEVVAYRRNKSLPPEVRAACVPKVKADRPAEQWNRFHIRLQGDRLTVHLNGQLVIDRAQLPGIPQRGPIGLQHHGTPIEFANLFIREL
jgi:hypothetical protein